MAYPRLRATIHAQAADYRARRSDAESRHDAVSAERLTARLADLEGTIALLDGTEAAVLMFNELETIAATEDSAPEPSVP